MSKEIVLTPEEETTLSFVLKGAKTFKGEELTKPEIAKIRTSFTEGLVAGREEAEAKRIADEKAHAEMLARNNAHMMPHDRPNTFESAKK